METKAFDAFGNELREGDKIAYIAGSRSYPHLQEGLVQKITVVRQYHIDLDVVREGHTRVSKLSTNGYSDRFVRVVKI